MAALSTDALTFPMRTLMATLCMVLLGVMTFSAVGCEEPEKEPEKFHRVTIGDERFRLELANTDALRLKGLSGRTEIAKDGGMIFVFPRAQVLEFVMRDCPIPIDIMFLDSAGRVVSMHEMLPEEPRGEKENEFIYDQRLKRYSSKFSAQFAIELKDGSLDRLKVKVGDKVDLGDIDALKKRAK